MGHFLREQKIPRGALIRLLTTAWNTGIGNIRTGATGIVLEHTKPCVITVMWFDDDHPGRTRTVTLYPEHISVSMSGFTSLFDVISLPEGVNYEKW